MIADVPLGAFLSGGVDSSIIVAIMADLANQRVRTFSIANADSRYDESEKSREVARLFKTEHTEWVVTNDNIAESAEKVLQNFDEPFGDSSALPSYVVSDLARRQVKVVLTGDGGDELFGGYTRYRIFQLMGQYARLPGFLRNGIFEPLLQCIPDFSGPISYLNKLKKLASVDTQTPFNAYHSMQCLGFSRKLRERLCPESLINDYPTIISRACFDALGQADVLNKALYTDMMIGLEGDMLTKVDRASMLASIEARSPFLDHRLVEFSFTIPPRYKVAHHRLKAILKDTFADRFPAHFLDKKKMGFGIPVGHFLRTVFSGRLSAMAVSGPLVESGLIDASFLRTLIEEHHHGRDHTFHLWCVFAFGLWYEKHAGNVVL